MKSWEEAFIQFPLAESLFPVFGYLRASEKNIRILILHIEIRNKILKLVQIQDFNQTKTALKTQPLPPYFKQLILTS